MGNSLKTVLFLPEFVRSIVMKGNDIIVRKEFFDSVYRPAGFHVLFGEHATHMDAMLVLVANRAMLAIHAQAMLTQTYQPVVDIDFEDSMSIEKVLQKGLSL